jgi:hypothetical protein
MTRQQPVLGPARPRWAVVLGTLAVGALLAACQSGTAPVRGTPVVTFMLDSSVALADSVHGEVVATGAHNLVSMIVTVFDTAGADSTGTFVIGGSALNAGRLDATFRYKVVHTPPGRYVRFTALVRTAFGDSVVARDSAHVTP